VVVRRYKVFTPCAAAQVSALDTNKPATLSHTQQIEAATAWKIGNRKSRLGEKCLDFRIETHEPGTHFPGSLTKFK